MYFESTTNIGLHKCKLQRWEMFRGSGIAISLLPPVLMTFESMYPKKKVQDYNGLFGLKRERRGL